MPKLTLDGGEPIDVADEKVAVYESQGYVVQGAEPEPVDPTQAENAVKRPAAKKATKKAAKKS